MCKGTHPSLFKAPCSKQLARHQGKKMGKGKEKGLRQRWPGAWIFLKRLTSKDTSGTLSIADLLRQISPK